MLKGVIQTALAESKTATVNLTDQSRISPRTSNSTMVEGDQSTLERRRNLEENQRNPENTVSINDSFNRVNDSIVKLHETIVTNLHRKINIRL